MRGLPATVATDAGAGDGVHAFFQREPLGFDAETPARLVDEVAGIAAQLARLTPEELLPWAGALLLIVALGLLDRRVRLALARRADTTAAHEGPRLRPFLASAGLRVAGQVAVPAVALGLAWFPLQGLLDGAPWTVALADALGVLVAWRVVLGVARALLLGPLAAQAPDAGARLLRGAQAAGRVATALLVAATVLEVLGGPADVVAVATLLFRVAVLVGFLWVWLRRRDLLRLFPDEGGPRYLAFRRVVERWTGPLLGASAALLLLYAAGFERAAAAILLRSYAILGLLVVVALADRWLDRLLRVGTDRERALLAALMRRTDLLVTGVVRLAIAVAILGLIGLWSPLVALLREPLFTIRESAISAWSVLKAISVVVAAILSSRVIRVILEQAVFPKRGLDEGAAYAIGTAVHYAVVVLGLGMALIAVGIDLAALAVFAGALGVGLGLGLQDVIRNFFAGFVLLFGGMVKKGDLITVKDTYTGRVATIGSRSVTVLTNDQSELVIPSTDLVNSTIVNWTRTSNLVRLHVAVGTSYGAKPPEVREALLEAARRCPLVLDTPAPDVWLLGFGDRSVDYDLLVWIDASRSRKDETSGKILFSVWEVLAERGIEIPFPQRDLHVRSVDEGVVRKLRG